MKEDRKGGGEKRETSRFKASKSYQKLESAPVYEPPFFQAGGWYLLYVLSQVVSSDAFGIAWAGADLETLCQESVLIPWRATETAICKWPY